MPSHVAKPQMTVAAEACPEGNWSPPANAATLPVLGGARPISSFVTSKTTVNTANPAAASSSGRRARRRHQVTAATMARTGSARWAPRYSSSTHSGLERSSPCRTTHRCTGMSASVSGPAATTCHVSTPNRHATAPANAPSSAAGGTVRSAPGPRGRITRIRITSSACHRAADPRTPQLGDQLLRQPHWLQRAA